MARQISGEGTFSIDGKSGGEISYQLTRSGTRKRGFSFDGVATFAEGFPEIRSELDILGSNGDSFKAIIVNRPRASGRVNNRVEIKVTGLTPDHWNDPY